jgi:hypothetical protein
MKKLTLAFIIILFCKSATYAQKQSDFNFLLGSWEMITEKGKTTENWTIKDGNLIGASYKHNKKGDSTLMESVIIKRIDGRWNYCVTAYENGKKHQVNFAIIKNANNEIKFQNKENDFPQNITYVNKGKNELYAYIDGTINGKTKEIKFPYVRRK